jgi:hypothetical protein
MSAEAVAMKDTTEQLAELRAKIGGRLAALYLSEGLSGTSTFPRDHPVQIALTAAHSIKGLLPFMTIKDKILTPLSNMEPDRQITEVIESIRMLMDQHEIVMREYNRLLGR